jgi:hypothetical protein
MLFVTPVDVVKTHLQKLDNIRTYREAIKAVYNASGVIGFLTGARLRMMQ